PLPRKVSGVFRHRLANPESRLVRGFDAAFPVPVSRHTEVRASDLPARPGLSVLADSPEAGLCLIEDREKRAVYMFNHLEYDAGTLRDEFLRDRKTDPGVSIPANYFPDDDPARPVANVWRPSAHLLYGNWLADVRRIVRPQMADTAAAPRDPGNAALRRPQPN